jgi:hypothetical protein
MLKYKYEIEPIDSVACSVPIETNGAVAYTESSTCFAAWCYAPVASPGCYQIVMLPKIHYFVLFYLHDPDAVGMSVDPFGLCTDGCEWTSDEYGCTCIIAFKRKSYRVPNLSVVTYVNVIDEF